MLTPPPLRAWGGQRPVGWIETALDALHASTGLPWIGTIVLATVGVRMMLLPLVIKTMRNSVILHNIRPEMEVRRPPQ